MAVAAGAELMARDPKSVVLPSIADLSLIGVADRGVPNRERIVLRPLGVVNLGEYALLLGTRSADGLTLPLFDHFFWFGGFEAGPPTWIYVYTGAGEFSQSTIPGTNEPVMAYHWGKEQTLFGTPEVYPMLVMLGGVTFAGTGETYAPASAEDVRAALKALRELGEPPARRYRPILPPLPPLKPKS